MLKILEKDIERIRVRAGSKVAQVERYYTGIKIKKGVFYDMKQREENFIRSKEENKNVDEQQSNRQPITNDD